ncbi:MAG: ABC transporter permease, partial [Xanthomonadaceae bacterium]|nr:ABC transporter permease [Xanthomonadaceae bacterium]
MNARIERDNIVTQALGQIGACGLFLLQILAAIPRSLRYVRETVRQLWFVGAMSLTIIMVCGLFVGMVLALQLYHVLSIFGGTAATGTVVAISIYRELGPVITALLFAGRAGTAITAEIGLMRATDQIAAMELMAVDPLAYVAAPRFLAGLIALPLLCCVFSALGIFGGHLVGVTWLGIDNGTFWSNMTATVDVWKDIISGVVWKSLAFGAVVALIAVFQ